MFVDGFSKPVLAGLDVPDHIIPRESAETGGVPLGSFYPPNIGKHFKVYVYCNSLVTRAFLTRYCWKL